MRVLKIAFALAVACLITGESHAIGKRHCSQGGCSGGSCGSGGCAGGVCSPGGPCASGSCSSGACANSGACCPGGTCAPRKSVTVNGEKRIELTDYQRIDADTIAVDGMIYKRAADGCMRPTGEKYTAPVGAAAARDALDQVNQQRAHRGLRLFHRDEGLSKAACECATYRARIRCHGHVQGGMGDFQFLNGAHASAAGCAAWPVSMPEFGACCVYDNYECCGAAEVIGDDNLKYMQVFVR